MKTPWCSSRARCTGSIRVSSMIGGTAVGLPPGKAGVAHYRRNAGASWADRRRAPHRPGSSRGLERHVPVRLEQLEPALLLLLERRLVRVQPPGDLGVAVLLDRRPVAVRDRDEHVPVGPAVAVEARRRTSRRRVYRPASSCSRRIGQWFFRNSATNSSWAPHFGFGRSTGPRSDRLIASWSTSVAAGRSSSHARSTWRASVRRLPTARRIVNRPRSRVCDRNTSPVRLTASMIAALCSSSAGLVAGRRAAPGRERKQTVENGTGASRSQSGSASTQPANAGRELQVAADPPAQPLQPEPAEQHPQLERPEPAAELRRVLVVVAHRRRAIERPQVLGHEAERGAQRRHPPGQQERRVERREQPLVGVDDDRIGALPARERRAQLRQRSRPRRRTPHRRGATDPRARRSSAIAATGSTDVDDVVPTSRRSRSAGGRRRGPRRSPPRARPARSSNPSLVGIRTSDARPRPSVMHAFSIELWASAEA